MNAFLLICTEALSFDSQAAQPITQYICTLDAVEITLSEYFPSWKELCIWLRGGFFSTFWDDLRWLSLPSTKSVTTTQPNFLRPPEGGGRVCGLDCDAMFASPGEEHSIFKKKIVSIFWKSLALDAHNPSGQKFSKACTAAVQTFCQKTKCFTHPFSMT